MKRSQEQGVVSLITSVLVSILFVIVVVSMVNVLTREQSQANDADEANRAFYAAQSGVEDGVLAIKTALASPTPLASLKTLENGGNCITQTTNTTPAKYSCLVLSRESNSLDGKLKADSVGEQIDLSGVGNVGSIVINWNRPCSTCTDPSLTLTQLMNLKNLTTKFTTGDGWGNNPAVIEMTAIRFKSGGANFDPTNPDDLGIIENLEVPSYSTVPNYGIVNDYTSDAAQHNPSFGSCNTTSAGAPSAANPFDPQYNCHVRVYIRDSATYDHLIRLRSRFNDASFSVQVYDPMGNPLAVPDQYESIDVTATAGGTERRVRAKVAIEQTSAALDYALFSDNDICKDFLLRDSRSGSATKANAGVCPF